MGIRITLGMMFALILLLTVHSDVEATTPPLFESFSVQQGPADSIPSVESLSSWGRDLRLGTIQLLKNVRRWWIRFSRFVQRSAGYWFGWLVSTVGLLLFGGLVSAVDRRILIQAWREGIRAALMYAWIGLVVFLRLLRDPRVAGRARLMVALAIVYGIVSNSWLETGSPILDASDEILVMGLASRWFVRRCPEAIIEQHAALARERVQAAMPSSEESSSSEEG
jgi:hypothetical protein